MISARRVIVSVRASAARSRASTGPFQATASSASRCSVSPAARASAECMFTQYAQPFSCEARSRTSSRSRASKPTGEAFGGGAVQAAHGGGKRRRMAVEVETDRDLGVWCRHGSYAKRISAHDYDPVHVEIVGHRRRRPAPRRRRRRVAGALERGIPGRASGRALPRDTAPLLRALARDLGRRGTPSPRRTPSSWRRAGSRAGRAPGHASPSIPGRTAGAERPSPAAPPRVRPAAGPPPDLASIPRATPGSRPRAARCGGAVRRAGYGEPRGSTELRTATRRVPRPRPRRRRLTGTDRRLYRPRQGLSLVRVRPGHDLGGGGVRPRGPPAGARRLAAAGRRGRGRRLRVGRWRRRAPRPPTSSRSASTPHHPPARGRGVGAVDRRRRGRGRLRRRVPLRPPTVGALQALAPDMSLYPGTASRSLAPACASAGSRFPPLLDPVLARGRTETGRARRAADARRADRAGG